MTQPPKNTRPLPGDAHAPRGQNMQDMAAMLRVDHAGEYGATRIYKGQLATLRDKKAKEEIRHMAKQEEAHLAAFNQLLPKHHVRPSLLMPFWHVAGFALGASTALMGTRAAMACTVAVESAITEHYDAQIATLPEEEAELKATIQTFRDEEQEHHDTGIDYGAEQAPFYQALYTAIRTGCHAAIALAKRV